MDVALECQHFKLSTNKGICQFICIIITFIYFIASDLQLVWLLMMTLMTCNNEDDWDDNEDDCGYDDYDDNDQL